MLRTMARRDSGLYYTKPKIGYSYNPNSTTALYLPLWHPGSLNYGILVNGTGLADNAPVNLVVGDNTITASQAGTFTIHLRKGYTGTVTSGTATITGSPVSITGGGQSVTAEGAGTFTVALSNVIVSKDLNEHLATITEATKVRQGRSFDGTDDRISVPDAPSLSALSNLSLGIWFNSDITPATWRALLSKTAVAANTREWHWSINSSGQLEFTQFDGVSTSNYLLATGTTNLADQKWHFGMVTWNGVNATGNIKLYADGKLETLTADTKAGTGGVAVDTTTPVEVGRFVATNTYCWDGLIGEVWIDSRVLTAEEVRQRRLATMWLYQ